MAQPPNSLNTSNISDDDLPVRRPAMDEIDDNPPGTAVGLPMSPPPQMRPMQQPVSPQFSASTMVAPEHDPYPRKDEHWVKAYWRPAMGWLYMLICFVDFIVFPAIAMFLPMVAKGFGVNLTYSPWQSLSLSNGGLMHLAFGAILGVSAWSRGQEKITGSSTLPSSGLR